MRGGRRPVLAAVADWGTRWYADPDGPPVVLTHRDCGSPVSAVLECGAGHRLDDPRDVVPQPGPGVRPFAG